MYIVSYFSHRIAGCARLYDIKKSPEKYLNLLKTKRGEREKSSHSNHKHMAYSGSKKQQHLNTKESALIVAA